MRHAIGHGVPNMAGTWALLTHARSVVGSSAWRPSAASAAIATPIRTLCRPAGRPDRAAIQREVSVPGGRPNSTDQFEPMRRCCSGIGSRAEARPFGGANQRKWPGRARPVSRDSPTHESNASAQRRVPGNWAGSWTSRQTKPRRWPGDPPGKSRGSARPVWAAPHLASQRWLRRRRSWVESAAAHAEEVWLAWS